jgi:hypothetical protein
MQLYPSVKVGVGHDDNVILSNTNEIDSAFFMLAPVARLVGEGSKTRMEFGYEGEYTSYEDSSADNYDDHRLYHILDLTMSDRVRLGYDIEYRYDHDGRGTTDIPNASGEPDEWESFGATGRFGFGAMSAQGRLQFEASVVDKEYQNNRANTVSQDKIDTGAKGTFFWRVGGRTDALAEVVYTDYDYKLASSLQDNDATYYYAGVKWEATGKTSGSVRLGYGEKDFDSPLLEDPDIFSWDIGVTWEPRTYSTVDFITTNKIEDSTGQGSSIDKAQYRVNWRHEWQDRLSTTINGAYEDLEYNQSTREDDFYLYGDNDSNIDTNDYEQNIFMLELTATL